MSFMMLMMFIIFIGVGLMGYTLGTRRLPPYQSPPQDRRLADQAERIELLEGELLRLQEQADFTEKLLTERSSGQAPEAIEGETQD